MSTAAKVGAFFLLALALTGILIWNIEDLKLGRKLGKTVSMQFDDVAGLKEKADVRVAGVLVGRVARIRLVGGRAVVDVELEKDVDLHQGASADIATLGMLGENYIELIPGSPSAPKLPDGTILKGREGVSLDSVSRLARDIEVDLRDVTGNLTKSLGGQRGQERIEAVVDNMVKLSQSLRQLIDTNRAGIDATTNNFREFSSNLSRLSASISMTTVQKRSAQESVITRIEKSPWLFATFASVWNFWTIGFTCPGLQYMTSRIRYMGPPQA